MSTSLVIAAHGTRVGAGVGQCHDLVAQVRAQLPGTRVEAGFVELVEPSIHEVVAELSDTGPVVVVPLMVGTGAHVQHDIPAEILAGQGRPGRVVQTAHLGAHGHLLAVLDDRIEEALAHGDEAWSQAETSVVLVGRGSLMAQANADHCALARLVQERRGAPDVVPGFIQVVQPDLASALDRARQHGATQIVVAPNFLFTGRLEKWLAEQSAAWQSANPEVQVRVAGVIGPCEGLARVVAERFREGEAELRASTEEAEGSPVYLAGLDLSGRRVLVAGAGRVASRRIDKFLDAGADVTVVAPVASPRITDLAADGRVRWEQRPVAAEDVHGAWYVLAACDDAAANALVSDACEEQGVFCVRADDARAGTAWTPATARHGAFTLGVVGRRDPRGSIALRHRVMTLLDSEAHASEED